MTFVSLGTLTRMTAKPSVVEATHHAAEHLTDRPRRVKPKLRGWLHAVTSPLTLAAGIVLIALSPTAATRVGSVVFMVTALLLFTVSAIYHRGTWSPRTWAVLQRFDHANIFLLIAGSYTPFALLMLEGNERTDLLADRLGRCARSVSLFRMLLDRRAALALRPRSTSRLGWAAVFYVDDFLANGSTAVFVLIAAGGLLYTLGGVVYGLQRPEPVPVVVRLPRGVPRLHDPGVRHPLRRRLAGDVLPALTPSRRGSWVLGPSARIRTNRTGSDSVSGVDSTRVAAYLRSHRMSSDRRCEPVSPRRSHRQPEGP